MNFSQKDQFFMKEALKLAKKGMGWTNPHPMVGAIIVKKGKIIATGYHRRFGEDHAEMNALKHATEDVRGGTMYVTLEPCHLPYDLHGQRKPCTEVIRESGIKTVHIAMLDSNPEVAGRGREMLKKIGIKTTIGIIGSKAIKLNEAYHHFMTQNRPFIVCTFSTSLDGKIATNTGDSKWITNEQARNYSHKLRSHYQAILVGVNTVLKDDPHLGTRIKGKKDPLRIILDPSLKIPLESQVLRDSNVLIITTLKHNKQKLAQLMQKGIQVLVVSGDQISISELLLKLRDRKVISVLVEGGGKTIGSFVDSGLVDKIYAFFAPILIGGEQAISAIRGEGISKINQAITLERISYKKYGNNQLIIGYLRFTQKHNILK